MDISAVTSFIKLPKKAYFLGAIVGGMLLFLSDEMLNKLGVLSFKNAYSMWIGIVFLLTLGMSFVLLIEAFFIYAKQRRALQQKRLDLKVEEERLINKEAKEKEEKLQEEIKEKEIYQKILTRLDDYEKAVLREFFISKKNTEELCFDDATVMGLIKKGVIKQVSNQAYHTDITGHIGKFRIDDRAIDYLEDFDFSNIRHVPRPIWVEKLEIYQTIQNKALEFGRQIKRM